MRKVVAGATSAIVLTAALWSGAAIGVAAEPQAAAPAAWPPPGTCIALTQLTTTDANNNTNEWPTASPDGQWIYYETISQGHFEVYRMKTDGTQREDLTSALALVDGRDNYGPVLSGDGTKLAFASLGSDGARVILADADGSNAEQISPVGQYAYMIDLNHDGTKAVWANNSLGYQIQYWDGATDTVTTLTPDASIAIMPQFTADETAVVYTDQVGDSSFYGDIYKVDVEGQNLVNLTDNQIAPHSWQRSYYDLHGSSRASSLSPDGSKILYRQYADGNNPQLFTMNVDGTGATQLTDDSGAIADAKYSPNGNLIAFIKAVGPEHWQLFVMTANGKHEVQVSDVQGAVLYYNWVDNRSVAFTAETWGSGVFVPGAAETRDIWLADVAHGSNCN